MAQKVLDALAKKFGAAVERTESDGGDEIAWIARDKLVEIATWLRDDPAMAFEQAMFVTAIDLLDLRRPDEYGVLKPVDVDAARFEVCYQLRSLKHRHRLRLKVRVTERDPRVASLTGVWSSMQWQERETFDMYGIRFDGHPDLRRIYLYEEFVGYPLRKDYPKDKRQPLVRRDDLPSPEATKSPKA
ncbi:MAG: NADH-quinone oxidoreductase subunit C [Kofleriaceae bacterium]|nr:NADH-quinone oxidoreductase subunit C [Myxococcales bacterium]MCB9560033.1 NADH-quinone oxidoreductase subunit C [Kofleriaceae bacterium]MCB9571916.1 NADH-quinone oxidoreductase subunit C [Kofleriaceae bacterium]